MSKYDLLARLSKSISDREETSIDFGSKLNLEDAGSTILRMYGSIPKVATTSIQKFNAPIEEVSAEELPTE